MTHGPKLSPAQRGLEAIKVYVPAGTAHSLRAQAQQLGIPVTAHLAPLLVAVGSGELRARHEYTPPPAPAPPAGTLTMTERLRRIPRLSESCRALLARVCATYAETGGDGTVDTNRELGAVLHVHWRTISSAVATLELAGWLLVKLYAHGANGRRLLPTAQAKRAAGLPDTP